LKQSANFQIDAHLLSWKLISMQNEKIFVVEEKKNARVRWFGQPLSGQIILICLGDAVSDFQSRFF
jgi:hypothetical protein